MASTIHAYVDGGSRGNPGPAAAAFVLADPDGTSLQSKAVFLGRATNNTAEYRALVEAARAAKALGAGRLEIFSDSELLVRQLQGRYRVKSDSIKVLFEQARAALDALESWDIRHVPRTRTKAADKLVNKAITAERDVVGEAETLPQAADPLRLGVLISGSGRTMVNILEQIEKGRLNAVISVVISSRSATAGVEKARAAGLEPRIVRRKDFPDINGFSGRVERELASANVELVVQAGWLCLWEIPPRYENRVMNIHPALLPSFGGRGMWGHHVHEAVLKAGCKVSGCTVHFCTNEYDVGPIIVQRCCPVMEDDSPEALAARVFEQECIAYPEAIRLFAEGGIEVADGRVRVRGGGEGK
jgi:formyltetrahydrofolate-dependent phosphoribosylglycinamide formyltransferase